MEILSLGNKIKKRRKELNLTLKELAGDRVTPAQLSYVETDKCKPSLDLLEYISERLGVEVDYLLESEKKQVMKYCQYNLKIAQVYVIKGDYTNAMNRLKLLEETSENYNIKQFIGYINICYGDIQVAKNNYDIAFENYFKALKIFSSFDDNENIIDINIKLGIISYHRKDYSSSAAYFNQCKYFVDKIGSTNPFLKVKTYYYLAMTYSKLGDDLRLSEYLKYLFDDIKTVCDSKKCGDILLAEAIKSENESEFDQAYKMADRSLDMYKLKSFMTLIGEIETNMGEMCSKIDYDGILFLNKAVNIKKACCDETLPLTLIATARYRTNRKEYELAFDAVNDALNVAIKDNRKEYEALSYYQLFKIFNDKEDYIKAEESIRRCIDILKCIGDNEKLPRCYFELGLFYKDIKREKESLDYISKCFNMLNITSDVIEM